MVTVTAWVVIAWVGGTAAILGSLMTIATLLLWLVPQKSQGWQPRLRLTAIAIATALSGFALLAAFPFPTFNG